MPTDISLITSNCLSYKTRKLSRTLTRLYDTELASIELKSTQFTMLCHLLKYAPIKSGDLAQRMGLDSSTLTRNLQTMIAAKWATQKLGSDARSRIISITQKGRDKHQEASIHWQVAQRRAVDLLGIERFNVLNSLLDECNTLLNLDT
jgi:DNA-binding MarR family transcriptional regulator